MLSEDFRKAWPYEFGLVYSVTLTKNSLETSLQVQNQGSQNFEFQVLMHTYLSVNVSRYTPYLSKDIFQLMLPTGYLENPHQESAVQVLHRQDPKRYHPHREFACCHHYPRDGSSLSESRPEGSDYCGICRRQAPVFHCARDAA